MTGDVVPFGRPEPTHRPDEPTGEPHDNLSEGSRPCRVCHDYAVVSLKGVVRAAGTVNDRGSAPCAYCLMGIRLARKLEAEPVARRRMENPLGYRWAEVILTADERAAQIALLEAEAMKLRLQRIEERAARARDRKAE